MDHWDSPDAGGRVGHSDTHHGGACETCINFRAQVKDPIAALKAEITNAVEHYRIYRQGEANRLAARRRISQAFVSTAGPTGDDGAALLRWASMMMLEDDDPTPGPEPFEGDEPIQNVVSKLGKAGLNNETRRLVGQALTDETLAEADNYGSDEHRLEVPPAFSAHCRPLVSEAHVHFLRNGAFYESNDRRCDAHRLAGRNPPVRCIDCVHYRLAPLLDTERCDELDSWRNLKESIRRFSRLISETARAFMPPAVREAKLGSMKQERRGHESELNRLRDDHRGLLAETAVEEFQEALNDGGTLSRRPRALASCLAWGPGYALCMFFNPDGNCPRFEGFE